MQNPTLVFSPLRNAVPAQGCAVNLLLRMQAPDCPADLAVKHTPKRLALVVDQSGACTARH